MAHFLLPASLALVPLLSRHPSSNLLHCDLYYTSRKFCDCLSHGCETLPKVYKTPVIMTPTIHRLPIWKHHQLMLSKLDTLHSSCSVQTFKKKKNLSWSYFKLHFGLQIELVALPVCLSGLLLVLSLFYEPTQDLSDVFLCHSTARRIRTVETWRESGTMKTLNLENVHVILVTFH